eukprot:GHUV01027041.1.p1 GENE.GHUV01027041.1~~GHUV01027041.1.p1  ORF type:complete len:215 (+),score=57.33 GHUV01027041.1:2152-2796(+)
MATSPWIRTCVAVLLQALMMCYLMCHQMCIVTLQPIVLHAGVGGAGIYARGFRRSTTIPPVAAAAIRSASDHNRPFNYVIVMLGINDLLREGKSAEDVKSGLQQIYSEALNAGSNVIAIPPFPAPGFVSKDDYKEAERKKLADLIKGMAADANGKQSARIIVMDLEADRFNFYNMDPSERSRWLDDGLHMTEMGYNILGRQIARVIDGDWKKRR